MSSMTNFLDFSLELLPTLLNYLGFLDFTSDKSPSDMKASEELERMPIVHVRG